MTVNGSHQPFAIGRRGTWLHPLSAAVAGYFADDVPLRCGNLARSPFISRAHADRTAGRRCASAGDDTIALAAFAEQRAEEADAGPHRLDDFVAGFTIFLSLTVMSSGPSRAADHQCWQRFMR